MELKNFLRMGSLGLGRVARIAGVATLLALVLQMVQPVLGAKEEEEEIPDYEVFHVEWDRVEVPYVISVWIIIASLAKIGLY